MATILVSMLTDWRGGEEWKEEEGGGGEGEKKVKDNKSGTSELMF